MDLQFQQTSRRKKLRVALVGPPGSGKTSIAASFPKPAFIIPRNEGSDAVLGEGFTKIDVGVHRTVDAAGVEHVGTRPPMAHMFQILDQLFLWQQTGQLHDMCETIVVEQLSHYSGLVELELTNDGAISMSGNNGGRWNAFQAHFQQMLDKLFKLDVHVVMTMHDRVRTLKDQIIGHEPAIAGYSSKFITSSCDLLGYCDREGALHTTYFCKRGAFDARHRLPGLASQIDNFNFPAHIAPLL